jgi:signal transduction histidine kinase
MAEELRGSPVLLSALPASRGQRRVAWSVSLLLFAAFLATLPLARISLPHFPAFVLIQQTLLATNDLITAALLFGQYSIARIRALSILAGGYLFTALVVIPHTLSFPGVFSVTGLIGAGPQSAAWLYIGWHAVLPVTIIVFALRREDEGALDESFGVGGAAILRASLAAVGAVVAMTLIVTVGQALLPALIENNHFTLQTRVAVGALLALPPAALLMLARKRPLSVLDLWLMVVMFAWLCTIGLGAFVSSGRFDVAWYAGRIFDWLTSLFVLLMLLSETIALYARNARAAAVERRERERRIQEMEAVLIHLSRVSELGQNVSSLIHEVNQPLTAISNYLSASLELLRTAHTERLKPILERTVEQAARATEIVRHLRDFIARRESEKRVEDVPEMLEGAVRLALVGIGAPRPTIEIRCAPDASAAVFDRIQIEQVVFNLVRNAIEAMADTPRRSLTIATNLGSNDIVEVSIADTGPGLAPDIRAKLFEPFVTTKPSGLGIGLSICRVIVEAHGGELRAEDNPGGGTVFRFTLPGHIAATLEQEDGGTPSRSLKSLT